MKPRIAAVAFTLGLAGCAVGPGYHPAQVVPATTRVGAGSRSDSARAFFDSLAAARAADSARPVPPALPPRALATDSIADLAWLDILRDSALTRLVATALRQNRDLALARARIREYRAAAGVARSPLFPSLALNGSTSTNKIALGSFAPVSYHAWRVTADVAWELDFWGGTRRGLQAAQADLSAQEAAARAVVLSLVSDVASGYLQLLELDQERAVAERTLATRGVTLDLARQRYARGVISELDVRQFEAQVAVPAARLAQVEQQRAQEEHALNVLLGAAPATIVRGTSLAQAVRAVIVPDSLPGTLLERRPDVREAERAYAAATARVGVADAARLPKITIIGSSGSQAATSGGLFTSQTDVYQLQAGVSIPLFTGGKLINVARAARARAEEARAAYEQTALTALREAGDALAGVRAARDQVAAQDTQAKALRRALQLAEARYRAGVANYLEVLDSQRSLFEAELALSQAQLLQLTAAVQLYKALGGSWSGDGEGAETR
ncbi:MAG: transporter [Gemmatimonadetes bacterium]|nr:MAG: transporter [Gemmatimonadota bacterium]PYP34372.1 MAG: transporter [Gemmatimonadota bacterium]